MSHGFQIKKCPYQTFLWFLGGYSLSVGRCLRTRCLCVWVAKWYLHWVSDYLCSVMIAISLLNYLGAKTLAWLPLAVLLAMLEWDPMLLSAHLY